jgi:hypothetical protein
MLELRFSAVDLGEEYDDYAERFVLYCPFSGNNLMETGWDYPEQLLYLENNLVGEPEYVSEQLMELYNHYLAVSEDEDCQYFDFLDYLDDKESECSSMMRWYIYHPDGENSDYMTVIYRIDR